MSSNLDITGGVKFFDKNKALFKYGNAVSASTNDGAAKYLLSPNKYVRWESIGSDDTTVETLTINFKKTTTLDRLFLVSHNLKDYSITYNGGSLFTGVSGLDGDLVGNIIETAYDKNTSYYKFDSVSVDSIEITATKTQTANQEKFITQFIGTVEIGTLAGFPRVQNVRHDRNIKGDKVLSGREVIQPGYETTSFDMNFKTYPVQNDISILETLHLREDSYLVWLCGGRYGSDHFTVEQRGWRLADIYNMKGNRPLDADFARGIYQNGVDVRFRFREVVE